jgi:deoxyribonuclease-4
MILGSHLSTSGGLHKALESAGDYGFPAVALFLRSPRQWVAPPLEPEDIRTFRAARKRVGTEVIVAHASYLINLAGDSPARDKGIAAVTEDLERCAALGIEFLVLHPGSCPDLAEGIDRIAAGLDEAMESVARKRVKLLLESTAGQGNCIGHRFEHLAELLSRVRRPSRYGLCLDTAHLFAAGYDLRTPADWRTTMQAFDHIVGFKHLCVMHVNDSKKPLASRVDRHEHIGLGEIGPDAFGHLVNDERFIDIPLILETPKGTRDEDGRDWDEINAEVLHELCRR